ncbi:MAG: TerB family tellurite resistance protein [Vicinamibacterales bacterium]
MSLLKWLGFATDKGNDGGNRLGEIELILAPFGRDKARYLACFAYILTRPARADHQVSDDEARLMEQLIAARTGVSAAQSATIVQIAREAARQSGGTEDFLITREFERIATREEKLGLLDSLFAIGAADHSILTVEDNEVRRVASELNLEHADYIEVRRRHIAQLKVLQRPVE